MPVFAQEPDLNAGVKVGGSSYWKMSNGGGAGDPIILALSMQMIAYENSEPSCPRSTGKW